MYVNLGRLNRSDSFRIKEVAETGLTVGMYIGYYDYRHNTFTLYPEKYYGYAMKKKIISAGIVKQTDERRKAE